MAHNFFDLTGRVAVVTGASRGLGQYFGRALARGGERLGRADQDLFYAFYRSGRSHACIATELGTTTKSVESRLYRLRTRLRAALERRGCLP